VCRCAPPSLAFFSFCSRNPLFFFLPEIFRSSGADRRAHALNSEYPPLLSQGLLEGRSLSIQFSFR